MKQTLRKSLSLPLNEYCLFCKPKGADTDKYYIEVTEWSNGEGYDILLEGRAGTQRFSLTWGEYWALTDIYETFKNEE